MYMPTHNYSHHAIKFTRDGGHDTRGCYSHNTTTSYSMILDSIDSIQYSILSLLEEEKKVNM